jgi:hypothetical protein
VDKTQNKTRAEFDRTVEQPDRAGSDRLRRLAGVRTRAYARFLRAA